jgi:hypothetical protein
LMMMVLLNALVEILVPRWRKDKLVQAYCSYSFIVNIPQVEFELRQRFWM